MENLGKLTAAIYRNMQSILNLKLSGTEIRSGQYDFFFVISRNEGLTQKELTERMFVEKSTTAKAIKDLVKKDFILKIKDKNDGRRELLYLTEKGHELKKKVWLIYDVILLRAQQSLSQDESIVLHTLLTRIHKDLVQDKKMLALEAEQEKAHKRTAKTKAVSK